MLDLFPVKILTCQLFCLGNFPSLTLDNLFFFFLISTKYRPRTTQWNIFSIQIQSDGYMHIMV